MGQFAAGKRAWGTCDRCGTRWLIKQLVEEVVARRPTGLLMCRDCLDKDHPQLLLGQTPVYDPQALQTVRPDVTLVDSRPVQWGWAPVGLPWALQGTVNDLVATAATGVVGITYEEPA